MTEADLADGLRLSRASGWNQTLEDWRLLLALGPGLFRVGVERRRRRGLGRRRPLRRRPRVDLHDPRRPGRARPRPRHAGVRRGAGASHRGAGARRPRGRGPRRDAGRPRPLRAARIRRRPAARADEARGPTSGATGALAPSLRPEPDGLAATRLMAPADRDAVLALDRQVFGADREAVLLDALARAPDLARVTVASRRIRGYCFGRHGDHSDHVGPVVAEDPAVARELVCAALAETRERPVILDARAAVWRRPSRRSASATRGPSRACTSATCGRRRGRRSSSPCAGRRSGEEDENEAHDDARHPERADGGPAHPRAPSRGAPPRCAPGRAADRARPAVLSRAGRGRHGGRRRDRPEGRAGARPAPRGLHGERGRGRAGDRRVRRGEPAGVAPRPPERPRPRNHARLRTASPLPARRATS